MTLSIQVRSTVFKSLSFLWFLSYVVVVVHFGSSFMLLIFLKVLKGLVIHGWLLTFMSERQGCLVQKAHKGPFATVCKALVGGVLVLSVGRQAGSWFPSLPKYIILDLCHSTSLYFTLPPFLFFCWGGWGMSSLSSLLPPVPTLWPQGQPCTDVAANIFVNQEGIGPISLDNTPWVLVVGVGGLRVVHVDPLGVQRNA